MSNPQPAVAYATITTVFIVKGADEFITFCTEGLGAEVLRKVPGPDNSVMHADLRFGDSTVMVTDSIKDAPTTTAISLRTPDCDALFRRAIAAGATEVFPPKDTTFGIRWARVVDRWRNGWTFATPLPGA